MFVRTITFLTLGALCLALSASAFPGQQVFRHKGGIHSVPAHVVAENENEKPIRFDGHRVLTVMTGSEEEADHVAKIVEELYLDLWTGPIDISASSSSIDIRVPPALLSVFTSLLPPHLPVSVKIPDVQKLIDSTSNFILGKHEDDFFKAYHTYEDIVVFMKKLAKEYTFVELVNVAKTYEGRDVIGIKFTGVNGTDAYMKKNGVELKKGVLFHGGQHAREWIGPVSHPSTFVIALTAFHHPPHLIRLRYILIEQATLTYMMHNLVTNYGKDDRITRAVDAVEWTLVPVFNVDGYIFSHTRNRMWRKNRQPNTLPFCSGTDTNRNWDYSFGKEGASNNPCSEAYHGHDPFSAPETKSLSEYIAAQENLISYIDFHAFSQLCESGFLIWVGMFPFGQCDELPPKRDFDDLTEASQRATKALRSVHGTSFASGPICETIYEASGSGVDWVYARSGVKYSFAVELRDKGEYGFVLPPEQIIPSGEEVLEAVLTLVEYIVEREEL
ncbi:hypothetical protein BC937DRAFT_94488 [Endogone sp. FLAS-F59071]|nr:hypothetical protein BC937DRAFT_94488 [Endogone sp. FLAS-F59071]|eukprot:RUS14000.1 hypothetical protein BC937DRAFT_94488 [Endogone sp. FLAS-F59071]